MSLKESQDYSRKVAEAFREIRLKKGLSHQAVADRAGLSRAAIQHIEKGIRNPTLVVCHAIASALEVSLASLLKRIEKP